LQEKKKNKSKKKQPEEQPEEQKKSTSHSLTVNSLTLEACGSTHSSTHRGLGLLAAGGAGG
jgi:hypothetical protein